MTQDNEELIRLAIAEDLPRVLKTNHSVDPEYQPKPEDCFPERSFNPDNWQNDAAQARAKGNLEWFYRDAWVSIASSIFSQARVASVAASYADEMLEELKKRVQKGEL